MLIINLFILECPAFKGGVGPLRGALRSRPARGGAKPCVSLMRVRACRNERALCKPAPLFKPASNQKKHQKNLTGLEDLSDFYLRVRERPAKFMECRVLVLSEIKNGL